MLASMSGPASLAGGKCWSRRLHVATSVCLCGKEQVLGQGKTGFHSSSQAMSAVAAKEHSRGDLYLGLAPRKF
ncbi:unnamed protein product [Nezara viridula]|uniref:Uncharacterized protein n=1 Tax=Nezara viridula TaxID=85310 RepID=A0A9P0HIB8_NEZVI|nr:unnamed protein product [Nezara viridula]